MKHKISSWDLIENDTVSQIIHELLKDMDRMREVTGKYGKINLRHANGCSYIFSKDWQGLGVGYPTQWVYSIKRKGTLSLWHKEIFRLIIPWNGDMIIRKDIDEKIFYECERAKIKEGYYTKLFINADSLSDLAILPKLIKSGLDASITSKIKRKNRTTSEVEMLVKKQMKGAMS